MRNYAGRRPCMSWRAELDEREICKLLCDFARVAKPLGRAGASAFPIRP
jgi:hypothetical protein